MLSLGVLIRLLTRKKKWLMFFFLMPIKVSRTLECTTLDICYEISKKYQSNPRESIELLKKVFSIPL